VITAVSLGTIGTTASGGASNFGGHAFEHAAWKGLLLALRIAFGVAGGVEVARWALKRRHASGA
jgi:hypothetical protein